MYNLDETEEVIWDQVQERVERLRTTTHKIVDVYPVAYIPEGEYIKKGLRAASQRAKERRWKIPTEGETFEQHYFKGETVEVRSQETINAEWVAVIIATGMIVGGSLVLLLGLAWWFI